MSISDLSPSNVYQLLGRDGQFLVDVIEEGGIYKIPVKATAAPQPIGNLFFLHALNNGSNSMSVDGSTVEVEFLINAEAGFDLIVNSMLFESFANGIKIDKFLSLNSDLANGILIEIKSQNETFQFLPIKNTQEFDSHFSFGPGRSFSLVFASGNDSMVARYGPDTPFIIKKQGTYASDDYIKVIVRDDISAIGSLQFIAAGGRE